MTAQGWLVVVVVLACLVAMFFQVRAYRDWRAACRRTDEAFQAWTEAHRAWTEARAALGPGDDREPNGARHSTGGHRE